MRNKSQTEVRKIVFIGLLSVVFLAILIHAITITEITPAGDITTENSSIEIEYNFNVGGNTWLKLDGVDDGILNSTDISSINLSQGTISMWVNITSLPPTEEYSCLFGIDDDDDFNVLPIQRENWRTT